MHLIRPLQAAPLLLWQNRRHYDEEKGLNMEQKRNLTGWAFLLPAALLIFVFCFYPMVQALILSFQKGTGSAVQPAGFANYARILKDATFQQCLFNTISIS